MEKMYRYDQILINNMKLGNENDILSGLQHKGALLRINAIINATKHKILTNEIIERLRLLRKDKTIVSGYTVSEFATASLHLLDCEKYVGDDKKIEKLILSKFAFYI